MAELTATTPARTQLTFDANPKPVETLEEFLALAASDPALDHAPEGALKVYHEAANRLPSQCRFFHVASNYYDWELLDRARVMAAPSTYHLCKTLVFHNTKWKQDESKPEDADRYWCVIVQYEGSVNVTKLEKAVREKTGASRKNMHLRIAPSEKSEELTGFINNAVSPIGMNTNLPILISAAIADLSPSLFYLGAGHVDWKIALPVQNFIKEWNATVVDVS